MIHARRLLSRPFLERVPDQSLLVLNGDEAAVERPRATRGASGGYGMVYLPSGRPVTVDLGRLAGDEIVAHWLDPRTGAFERIGRFPSAVQTFTPPSSGPGNDWVLVLDHEAIGAPPPGAAADLSSPRR